jgi:transposase
MTMEHRRRERQGALFVMALPKSPGHPLYPKLNALLAEAECDCWIERRCEQYDAIEEKRGQPSIPPGVYFRTLLVEGIDSQRGIAWRCPDSLSLRQLLGVDARRIDPRSLDLDQRAHSAAGGVCRAAGSCRDSSLCAGSG